MDRSFSVIMELFYCTGLHILLVIAMGANTLLFKSVDANFITGPWIGQKGKHRCVGLLQSLTYGA